LTKQHGKVSSMKSLMGGGQIDGNCRMEGTRGSHGGPKARGVYSQRVGLSHNRDEGQHRNRGTVKEWEQGNHREGKPSPR